LSLSRIKSLAKDSFVYGIGGIISRMITIFLVPLYTRIFQPSDYGIISLINTTFFVVTLLSVCALDNSAGRWFYDTDDEKDRKRTVASWFWFQLGLSILLSILMFLILPLFSRFVLKESQEKLLYVWLLACLTLPTNILPTIVWNWYRFNRKPRATIFYTLSQSLLTIILTILFVVVLRWGIFGVYAALFSSSFLFSAIALLVLGNWLHVRFFDVARIKEMLRFSLPLIPAAIAYWLINSTDAYFIQFFKGQSEVGLFSIGASLASGVALFTGAFQQAWGPFAFSIMNEPDAKRTYANVFLTFGVFSSLILLSMFLFTPEILTLLTTPKYYDSAWVASILSINLILIAFTYIASVGTGISKNNKYYSIGILFASVLTILLDVVLIPIWGKEGSAIATVLAQLIVPVYLFFKAQKLYSIPYPFKKVSLVIAFSIIVGITCRLIKFPTSTISFVAKAATLVLFLSFVYFFIRDNVAVVLVKLKLKREIARKGLNVEIERHSR
jgi:O-antigen/teichoic acid export membrane protein